MVLGTEGDHNVSFYQNNAAAMTLDGTGLGIGTAAPGRDLSLVGVLQVTDATSGVGASDGMLISTSTGNGLINYNESGVFSLARGGTEVLTLDTNSNVGIGTASPATKLTVEGAITLKEQAAADADTAAYGQIWVKTGTPNTLYFTDDAGTDTPLTGGANVTTVSTESQSLSLSENGKDHIVRIDISSTTAYSKMTIPRPSACPAGRTITFTVALLGDGDQSLYIETGNTSDRFISNYDKFWGTDNSGVTTPWGVAMMSYPLADQYGAENMVFTNTGTEWLMNDGVTENWSSMWYTVEEIS